MDFYRYIRIYFFGCKIVKNTLLKCILFDSYFMSHILKKKCSIMPGNKSVKLKSINVCRLKIEHVTV